MALSKKTTDISMLLRSSDYSSFANKESSITYSFTIQNEDITIVPEFWSGGAYDESIGGKRISNLRGYRVKVDLNFDSSFEKTTRQLGNATATQSTFRALFNDLMYCFTNGEIIDNDRPFAGLNIRVKQSGGGDVAIYTDDSGANTFMNFVPEDMSYRQQYSNQIGRFIPRMSFVSETLMPNIPSGLEGVL